MERQNKSQSSNEQRSKRLLWLFLALIVTLISASIPAHAGVQLQGWRDLNPSLTPDGMAGNAGTYQYVLFGKYSGNPILWRILSADQTGTERRGFLYSEKALEEKQFDSIMGSNNYGKSAIRTFLVGTGLADFYRASNFTDAEKSVVIEQSFTTTKGDGTDLITTTNNAMFLLSSGDLQEPQYGFLNGPGNDVNREAVDTGGSAVSYWTRSPNPSALLAYYVYHDGKPNFGMVSLSLVFVRPACFLNLESVLFKAASNDFALSTPSAGVAGSPENPYFLVLPGEVPTSVSGWTTTFASADNAPVRATYEGQTVTLEWSTAISHAVKNWPAPTDFVLSTGQSPVSVISDAKNPNLLKLTFAANIAASSVKLSYNLNTDAIAVSKNGNQAIVVGSFANLDVESSSVPNTQNVIPTQARFDGLTPESLSFLLNGAALTAANAGNLNIVVETPEGNRISLVEGDYRFESRTLTFHTSFLSKLGNGTHTIYLYRDNVQVGKITLIVTNSTGGGSNKDSGSSGCNAGVATGALLLLLGGMAALRKKN